MQTLHSARVAAYRLLVALAKRCLADKQNDRGEWPMRQQWEELGNTSRATFLRQARDEAGITDHDAFLKPIRAGMVDVDPLFAGALEADAHAIALLDLGRVYWRAILAGETVEDTPPLIAAVARVSLTDPHAKITDRRDGRDATT